LTTEQIKQMARELVKSAPQGEMCKWALDALQQAYVAGRVSAGGRGAPLTDAEIDACAYAHFPYGTYGGAEEWRGFARAILARSSDRGQAV
jgi:hypothetical protein